VLNYVYVKQGATTSDATAFSFKVALSEIDKGAKEVAQYYDIHYETLLTEFKTKFDTYMKDLPTNVIINDKTIDLTKYALKTDLPDTTQFVTWADLPALE